MWGMVASLRAAGQPMLPTAGRLNLIRTRTLTLALTLSSNLILTRTLTLALTLTLSLP